MVLSRNLSRFTVKNWYMALQSMPGASSSLATNAGEDWSCRSSNVAVEILSSKKAQFPLCSAMRVFAISASSFARAKVGASAAIKASMMMLGQGFDVCTAFQATGQVVEEWLVILANLVVAESLRLG